MGAVVAETASREGFPGTLDPLDESDISGPDELEEIRDDLVRGEWQSISASFEASSENIKKGVLYGNIDADANFSRFKDHAKLQSFVLKSDDGGAVRFYLKDNSVSLRRYRKPTDETNVELPDYQTIYLVAQATLYAIYSVDQFINQNGLRPVVDEVRERRWVILVTCAIITAFCQVGSC